MGKKKKTRVKKTEPDASLADVVGHATYDVWLGMLAELAPGGRTHRLAPMIGGMLQYAYNLALQQDPPAGAAALWLTEIDEYLDDEDDYEDYEDEENAEEQQQQWRRIEQLVHQLFTDAGVAWERTNAKGKKYSVSDAVIQEFIDWERMPWE